jgi:hypothetical protein
MDTVEGAINLTKVGASMVTEGIGSVGSWAGITVCLDSIKNICAVDRLKSAGYGIKLLKENWIVDKLTEEKILECTICNDMPYVSMQEFFNLPDLSQPFVHLSDNMGIEPMKLLHG